MLKRVITAAAFLTMLCSPAAAPCEEGTVVTELTVTTRVVKGKPVDSVRSISSSSPRTLYCFTRVARTEETETVIRHVWYRDDEKVAESELPVRGASWRTYSKKLIPAKSAGKWRVEVLDASGTLLKSREFKVN
ncbi:MAG TPA: DUF2914 domain-containing protein [Verrucomicrobiae bacterium]|nr:DUF2914 domain-containing protein [Verrucomicrobiae bacterium]